MKKTNQIPRRNFMKAMAASAAGGTALAVGGDVRAQSTPNPASKSIIRKNSTILFQGDSITDAGRRRRSAQLANHPQALGQGYALLSASQLLAERPGEDIQIFNRGSSGFKVFQLANTWDKNCLEMKPDVLSILIGVNDIWHTLDGKYDGTVEIYERDYRALLQRTLKALPKIKLVICEPFVLRCGVVNAKWFPEFDKYRAVARKLADEFDTLFVPFQSMFDDAVSQTPAEYWANDGVHPSIAGAYLMAQEWLKVVGMDSCQPPFSPLHDALYHHTQKANS